MKFKHIILLLIIASPMQFWGQYLIKNSDERNKFSSIPHETIFVHFNDNMLFAGEQLYYKVYCLNPQKSALSEVSKIAYIELVGADRKAIFMHKIELSSGIGQGDFFIPTSVPSGNYKLIAYTQWMRNFDARLIFTADLSIINPYRKLTSTALQTPSKSLAAHSSNSEEKAGINLMLPKTVYPSRAEVVLTIENSLGISGNYSLTIRKKQAFTQIKPISFSSHIKQHSILSANAALLNNDSVFLPEIRGEIFTGKLLNSATEDPIPNEIIAISIPEGERSIIKFAKTDSSGNFYSLINDPRTSSTINIAGPFLDTQPYRLLNKTHLPLDYANLHFPEFEISDAMQEDIIAYSIQNQIENAYIHRKADSLIPRTIGRKVYEDHTTLYLLDDYNRFPSFRETVVEIIDDVFIKRVEGRYALMLRADDEYFVDSADLPLVLVDGIVLSDIGSILSYSARNIESISLTKGNHYLGPEKFHGIIAIKTKELDFWNSSNQKNSTVWEIAPPEPLKKYFAQQYAEALSETNSHLPDFRKQLLWEPQLELASEDKEVRCFTSDVKGDFEIRLEGFSKAGKPISAVASFRVE